MSFQKVSSHTFDIYTFIRTFLNISRKHFQILTMHLTYTPFGNLPLSTLHSDSNVFKSNKPNHLTLGSQQNLQTSSNINTTGRYIAQMTFIQYNLKLANTQAMKILYLNKL